MAAARPSHLIAQRIAILRARGSGSTQVFRRISCVQLAFQGSLRAQELQVIVTALNPKGYERVKFPFSIKLYLTNSPGT